MLKPIRKLFACGCRSQYEHWRDNCTKEKVGNYGKARLFKRIFFRREYRVWNPHWEEGGVIYNKKSAELETVPVKGMEDENLLEFAWYYDDKQTLFKVLHQPRDVILDCFEFHFKHMKYGVRSLEVHVDEIMARDWNMIMDTLADLEVYKQIIGPIRACKGNEKLLKYKWTGPLTTEETRKLHERKQYCHRRFVNSSFQAQRAAFNAESGGVIEGSTNSSQEASLDLFSPAHGKSSIFKTIFKKSISHHASSPDHPSSAFTRSRIVSDPRRNRRSDSTTKSEDGQPGITGTTSNSADDLTIVDTSEFELETIPEIPPENSTDTHSPRLEKTPTWRKAFTFKKSKSMPTEATLNHTNTVMPEVPHRSQTDPGPESTAEPATPAVNMSGRLERAWEKTVVVGKIFKGDGLFSPSYATM